MSASNRGSEPLPNEGYARFLVNRARYEALAEEHIYSLLAEGLDCMELNAVEQIGFRRAAELALWGLHSAGIELSFDENNEFKFVVT